MKALFAALITFSVLAPDVVVAGTDCRTYRSGSETITVCSDTSNPRALNTRCRSYKSGSVTKTSCS